MQASLRTPCPQRIFEDTGVAFTIGAIGGALFQCAQVLFTRYRSRSLLRVGSRLRFKVPVVSGNFALWGLSFSTSECALQKFGVKNQPLSAVIGGGITGAVLAAQRCRRAIVMGAVFGFIILAAIELAIKFAENMLSQQNMDYPNGPTN